MQPMFLGLYLGKLYLQLQIRKLTMEKLGSLLKISWPVRGRAGIGSGLLTHIHGLYLTTFLSLTLLLIIKELGKEEIYKSSFKICSPCLVILFYDFSAENGSGLANTPDY